MSISSTSLRQRLVATAALLGLLVAGLAIGATAEPKKASTAEGASQPATAAATASSPTYVRPNLNPPAQPSTVNRFLPGRVIIGEILSYDASKKVARVRNLRGEEIDLVITEKTRVDAKLQVGEVVRTRFDNLDGKNVPFFITSRNIRQTIRLCRLLPSATAP